MKKEPEKKQVCFDLVDWPKITWIEALEKCDVYFKRSYDAAEIDILNSDLKAKVRPYGLYYSCRSIHEVQTYKRLDYHNKLIGKLSWCDWYVLKKTYGYLLMFYLLKYIPRRYNKLSYLSTNFEVNASEPTEKKIIFLSQVWSPNETPRSDPNRLKQMNDMRAEIIRTLRKHFGDTFIGGLRPTSFARQYYSDCISDYDTHKSHYLELLKRCLIAITTTGLHGSNGGKLAEYIAASRCIVTEPLRYCLPVPLEKNRNILTFTTPDECVSSCEKILGDSSFAHAMRVNNEKYYREVLKPDKLIERCLNTVFEDHVDAE